MSLVKVKPSEHEAGIGRGDATSIAWFEILNTRVEDLLEGTIRKHRHG
jgi:hypothetical protein